MATSTNGNNASSTTSTNQIHSLLTPDNCALVLIDHQPQMAFGVQSIDRQTLINNVVGLTKAAKIFGVPVVLMTIAAKSFSGDLFPQIQELFPDQSPVDRTSMNSWDDEKFRAAVEKTGRKKLVIAALWTPLDEVFGAIRAVHAGRKQISTDAAHKLAERVIGDTLTEREREVLRLMLEGKSNAEIAEAMFITEGTVKFHVTHILSKLGVADRTQAVVLALKRGLARI